MTWTPLQRLGLCAALLPIAITSCVPAKAPLAQPAPAAQQTASVAPLPAGSARPIVASPVPGLQPGPAAAASAQPAAIGSAVAQPGSKPGQGGSSKRSQGSGQTPDPPRIMALTSSSNPVLGGNQPVELQVTAEAGQALGSEAYQWACDGDCGSFNQTDGDTVIWRSPADGSGPFVIRVRVEDTEGNFDEETLALEVIQGSNTLNLSS